MVRMRSYPEKADDASQASVLSAGKNSYITWSASFMIIIYAQKVCQQAHVSFSVR